MDPEFFNTLNQAICEEECEEVNFDQLKVGKLTAEAKNKLEGIVGLAVITMNSCELESLDNFPNLPNLIRLELIDNKIKGADLANLKELTGLQSLSIGSNDITSFDDLAPLATLENLIQLDLSGTELTGKEGYREKVFGIFSGLQILDNLDKNGQAIEYSDDEDEDEEYEYEDGEEEFFDDEFDENEVQDEEGDDLEEAGKPEKKLKV